MRRELILVLYFLLSVIVVTADTTTDASTLKVDVVSDFINICTQHAPKCPLDESSWAGEPGGWQYTGKKWTRHSGTPSGRNIIWEWSRPYAGATPEYIGQRENHYSDFTNVPSESPDFVTAPYTYDWERWELGPDNNIFHQYGRPTESESWHIGETNCTSGVYYPVTDHNTVFSSTSMHVLRDGYCVGGGYIFAHLLEQWGAPMSLVRLDKCDDVARGIPDSESVKGNTICKLSPYVGVVYQGYAWGSGPPPTDAPTLGCEVVVYAWGWEKPQTVSSGQGYEAWFRNGELRFSRWINLSSQVSGDIPAPDDHAWWNARCEPAWDETTNVVYSGVYKIGSNVYTDTLSLPSTVSAEIAAGGGVLTSTLDDALVIFPPDAFTETVIVSHTIRSFAALSLTGDLYPTNRYFELSAVYSGTHRPAQPIKPYTITIRYTPQGRAVAIEDTLSFYYWDGARWVKEVSSQVYSQTDTLVATPRHFSLWAVLGHTQHIYLPMVLRNE